MSVHVMTCEDIDRLLWVVRKLGPQATRTSVLILMLGYNRAAEVNAYVAALSEDEFRTLVANATKTTVVKG